MMISSQSFALAQGREIDQPKIVVLMRRAVLEVQLGREILNLG